MLNIINGLTHGWSPWSTPEQRILQINTRMVPLSVVLDPSPSSSYAIFSTSYGLGRWLHAGPTMTTNRTAVQDAANVRSCKCPDSRQLWLRHERDRQDVPLDRPVDLP